MGHRRRCDFSSPCVFADDRDAESVTPAENLDGIELDDQSKALLSDDGEGRRGSDPHRRQSEPNAGLLRVERMAV